MPENAVEVRRASNSVLWKPGAGHNMKGRTEKATDNAIGQVRVRRRKEKYICLQIRVAADTCRDNDTSRDITERVFLEDLEV